VKKAEVAVCLLRVPHGHADAHNSFFRDVFSVFILHNSDSDHMLKTVFWTVSVAVDYLDILIQSCVNL